MMCDLENLSGVRVTVNLKDPGGHTIAEYHSVEVGLSENFLVDFKH